MNKEFDYILCLAGEADNLNTFDVLFHKHYKVHLANNFSAGQSIIQYNDIKGVLSD